MKALLIISGLGVLAMLAEIFKLRKPLYMLMLLGLLAALFVNLTEWGTFKAWYNDMLLFDNYAIAFSTALIAISFLWVLTSFDFFADSDRRSDLFALTLFSLAGGICMVSFADLSMLFIGIELLSIPLYVLAASNKRSLRSNEAGFKYFLIGAFATGFLLFGIAMVYAVTASFNLAEIGGYIRSNSDHPLLLYTGIFLIMTGLCFKVAAFPFHFWVPDVYEGSPGEVTAFMATVVKTAAFAAFLRLFYSAFGDLALLWSNLLWIIAALSMVAGNILAVYQTSLKRMLAYSSIAHAGYMMLAIIASNSDSASSMLLYLVAYSIATLAAFTFLIIVSNHLNSENISDLKGLSRKNPLLAFAITVAVLSMAGIPPVAGFFAKYFIFYTAIQENYLWLVLIAIISSLIGVYYYFRILIAIFSSSDTELPAIPLTMGKRAFLCLSIALIILIGLAPNLIIDLL